MKQPTLMPVVEKAVPLPPAAKKDERNRSRSPWPEFLLKLKPGDSFVTTYPTSQHVMTTAKYMGIPLVRQEVPKEQHELLRVRIWRTA
jgi:hypothetical protein